MIVFYQPLLIKKEKKRITSSFNFPFSNELRLLRNSRRNDCEIQRKLIITFSSIFFTPHSTRLSLIFVANDFTFFFILGTCNCGNSGVS